MLNRDFQLPNTGPCPWLFDWSKSDIFAYWIPVIPIGVQSLVLFRSDGKYHGCSFILISTNYLQTFQQSLSDYLMSFTLADVIRVRNGVVLEV